jgi:hypothetical protein
MSNDITIVNEKEIEQVKTETVKLVNTDEDLTKTLEVQEKEVVNVAEKEIESVEVLSSFIATAINTLTDTVITDPKDEEKLVYRTGKWRNKSRLDSYSFTNDVAGIVQQIDNVTNSDSYVFAYDNGVIDTITANEGTRTITYTFVYDGNDYLTNINTLEV